jgi:hypothetical protein
MAKQEGWRKGVGAYSKSGPTLTTPKEPPSMRANNRGSGEYSRSDFPMSHPSAAETAGNTRPKTGRLPDGARELDPDSGNRPANVDVNDASGYSAKLPRR